MKWAALTVVAVVVGAVASFAIYTFGWRNSDDDRARAEAYADQMVALCGARCSQADLDESARHVWKVRLRLSDGNGVCFAIQLDDFAPRHFPPEWIGDFHGVARTRC